MSAVPRVVVSAPSSGHGKTALAVGLLAAFAGRGLSAVGFKVGPDHTDAAYLGAAAGSPGRNLDPRLVGAHRIAPLFAHAAQGRDIAVVEGTMGLFDSLAGRVETDSTAGVAAALRAPVIMVVDVGAMGQSVAALMHGFRAYDELTWLGGVILNRVASDRHEQLLREALDDIGVPVYGALRRRDLPSTLPPRHEGVVPVLHREVEALRGIRRLGESIAATVDLDGLLALAHSAPNLPAAPWSPASELAVAPDDTAAVHVGRRPVVALAGGPGLSFAYAETRELLEAAGATVVAVDPLRDELLPEGTDALVIGGALPEAYAEELSANRRLCGDVADLARSGRPVVAEGAGLLWLAQAFDGRPMCGVLEATGTTGDQMVVGYRDATARATTAVAEVGARVVGYKQHRGVVSPRAGETPAWTWNSGTPEGFVWRRVHASQLSLHWAGFPEIARRLVLAARPGDSPAPGGSWARATGAVPVVGGALDYGTAEPPTDARGFPSAGEGLRLVPGGGEAPRLRAAPGGAAPADETEPASAPPRLRVVPPLADDDDPTDGRGFAARDPDATDGFGFAGVPGARAGGPMGDGYAYVVPGASVVPGDDGREATEQRPPVPPQARGAGEFGFPLGRGGHPAAGSGFGPARATGQASAVPSHDGGVGPARATGQASAVPSHDGGVGPARMTGQASAVPSHDGGVGPARMTGHASAVPSHDGGFGPVGLPGSASGVPGIGGGIAPPGPAGQPSAVPAHGRGYGPVRPSGQTSAVPSHDGGVGPARVTGQASAVPSHDGGFGLVGLPGPASGVPGISSGIAPPGPAGQPSAVPTHGRGYGPVRPSGQTSAVPPRDGGFGPAGSPAPGVPGISGGIAPSGPGGPPQRRPADRFGSAGSPGHAWGAAEGVALPGPAGGPSPGPAHGGGFTAFGPPAPAGVSGQLPGAGGETVDRRPGGMVPVSGGQPVPGHGGERLSGRAAAGGALAGGTAEVPAVPAVPAPRKPHGPGGGRIRDEDGGIG